MTLQAEQVMKDIRKCIEESIKPLLDDPVISDKDYRIQILKTLYGKDIVIPDEFLTLPEFIVEFDDDTCLTEDTLTWTENSLRINRQETWHQPIEYMTMNMVVE